MLANLNNAAGEKKKSKKNLEILPNSSIMDCVITVLSPIIPIPCGLERQ